MYQEYEEASSVPLDTELQKHLESEESKVEHCFFPWTIKAILAESKRSSGSLGTLLFSASDDVESFTMWQIELNMHDTQNDIQIHLTRLKSQNTSPVFARFHWEILDVKGNKLFPGSVHTFAYAGDRISKTFVMKSLLLKNKRHYLADGDLRVLCEMSVFGRTIEDIISSSVRANVPYGLYTLSEDMERLFFTESAADLRVSALDGTMHCHKSVLSARSHVFSELIKMKISGDCRLDLGKLKADVLHAILMHMYCGSIDMYLKHTIPKDLHSEAKKYGLLDLQKHLDFVNSNNLTRLKSLNVTWKLPFFKFLILQPKVVLYCPETNSRTFYDNRWCFKLDFDSTSDEVNISVIRKQDELSKHFVRFVVQVENFERIAFEKTKFLVFDTDGIQGMNAFMTKGELCNLLSFEDTLILKCSLEVLYHERLSPVPENTNSLSAVIQLFSRHMEASLRHLSEDLIRLFDSGMLSDTVVKTKIGEISFHSCIADARFYTPEKDLKAFLENLSPTLVQSFFHFLYGGDIDEQSLKFTAVCQKLRLTKYH